MVTRKSCIKRLACAALLTACHPAPSSERVVVRGPAVTTSEGHGQAAAPALARPAVATAPHLTAEPLKGKLLAWFEEDPGSLEGGVIQFRLHNDGTAIAKLASPGVELSGAQGMRHTCKVYTASARAEHEAVVIGERFDYALKPGALRIIRMVFRCPRVAGKSIRVARQGTYRIELSMTYQGGRVVVGAEGVRPIQHPGVDGGI